MSNEEVLHEQPLVVHDSAMQLMNIIIKKLLLPNMFLARIIK